MLEQAETLRVLGGRRDVRRVLLAEDGPAVFPRHATQPSVVRADDPVDADAALQTT
jgi:hypothetical protein